MVKGLLSHLEVMLTSKIAWTVMSAGFKASGSVKSMRTLFVKGGL